MRHLTERNIRAILPVIRLLQTWIPPGFSNRLLAHSITRTNLAVGVRLEEVSADGVHCAWLRPDDCLPGRVLLYLHGGGFVFGVTSQHLQLCARLAQSLRAPVLFVDYRLAPQHTFPAALDDCVCAYEWLLKQGFSARGIAVAGDSAGGNLTLTTLMRLRDCAMPLPAAAACLSPVTDLTGQSRRKNFKDPLLPQKAMDYYSKSYIGQNDPNNPLISPILGDLRGLPPLLVHAGEEEILCEDGLRIVERAKAAGVNAHFEVYPRMWHVWQIFLSLPQAVQSLHAIAQFLGSHLMDERQQEAAQGQATAWKP